MSTLPVPARTFVLRPRGLSKRDGDCWEPLRARSITAVDSRSLLLTMGCPRVRVGWAPDEFLGAGSPTGPGFKGQQWDDPRAWGRSSDVDPCTLAGRSSQRIAGARSSQRPTPALGPVATRPGPPRVTAYRVGNRVVVKYATDAKPSEARKWSLVTSVSSSDSRYTPLTRRTQLVRPSGTIVQPLGLGRSPFRLYASVIDHLGVRSRVVSVPIRLRR